MTNYDTPLITVNFAPAPIIHDVPEACESCYAEHAYLKPILRPIEISTGLGYPTVGYVCDRCAQIHLYR